MSVLSFPSAIGILATSRNHRRKLENNTYLEMTPEGVPGVKLHGTFVVKINPDGTYTLDSGGWQTVTTKDRINGYSPVALYQHKGEWFVATVKKGRLAHETATPFKDGMRVDKDGQPV